EHLQALPDWDEKWKDAIVESLVGRSVPYEYYPQSSGNTITHAVTLSYFLSETTCKLESLDTIFEFGGGYGCMCRLIHRLGFSGEYVNFDLPAMLGLQNYYLGKTTKGQITFLLGADEFTGQIRKMPTRIHHNRPQVAHPQSVSRLVIFEPAKSGIIPVLISPA
ncbi:unnamed protein product, partial [marine sediment metagenome]